MKTEYILSMIGESKITLDDNGNLLKIEHPDDTWIKYEYDKNNNEIYYEDSNGRWWKNEYDENNNKIYYENSYGDIWQSDGRTIKKGEEK